MKLCNSKYCFWLCLEVGPLFILKQIHIKNNLQLFSYCRSGNIYQGAMHTFTRPSQSCPEEDL